MKGYDLDGCITIGIKPERDGVIITGRSYERAPETYEYLRSKGIFNVVYFNPVEYFEQTLENSAKWKAKIIEIFKIEEFIEDDPRQAKIIKSLVEVKIKEPYVIKTC